MLIFNFFPVCAHNDFCSLRSMCIFALKLFCLPLLVEFSTFYLSYILSFGGIVKKLSVSTFDNLIGAFNCSTWLFSNGTLIKLFALIIESKLLFQVNEQKFFINGINNRHSTHDNDNVLARDKHFFCLSLLNHNRMKKYMEWRWLFGRFLYCTALIY